MGLGVFARKRYYYEELIGEVQGEVIDDADYSSDYCMDMGDTRALEPAAPFRYMNHSCRPNCRFHWYDVAEDGDANQQRRIFVFATEDIEVGDELTIDYAWPAEMAIVCRCGSAACRGWVVAEHELAELLAIHAQGATLSAEGHEYHAHQDSSEIVHSP